MTDESEDDTSPPTDPSSDENGGAGDSGSDEESEQPSGRDADDAPNDDSDNDASNDTQRDDDNGENEGGNDEGGGDDSDNEGENKQARDGEDENGEGGEEQSDDEGGESGESETKEEQSGDKGGGIVTLTSVIAFGLGVVVGVPVATVVPGIMLEQGGTVFGILLGLLTLLAVVSLVLWDIAGRSNGRPVVSDTAVLLPVVSLVAAGIVLLTADTDLLGIAPVVSPPVPMFVYAYAVVGAFGYVFTVAGERLRDDSSDDSENEEEAVDERLPGIGSDIDRRDVYRWILRVPAAIPLAAAVYLLASLILPEAQFGDPQVFIDATNNTTVRLIEGEQVEQQLNTSQSVTDISVDQRRPSDRLLAGISLLVGLFVNTTYIRLNQLAVRLVGTDDSDNDQQE